MMEEFYYAETPLSGPTPDNGYVQLIIHNFFYATEEDGKWFWTFTNKTDRAVLKKAFPDRVKYKGQCLPE